jgi:hypothetical protein
MTLQLRYSITLFSYAGCSVALSSCMIDSYVINYVACSGQPFLPTTLLPTTVSANVLRFSCGKARKLLII